MTTKQNSLLGKLADPNQYTEQIPTQGYDVEELCNDYYKMLLIRTAEKAIANLVIDNFAKCPCHLAVGQEAIAVGVSNNLNNDDFIFGNHRSHAHYLALGGQLDQLMAEILGKEAGCSNGMGGSMHLTSEEAGFKGSVPIVAGTIPVAVGAALAAKMNGNNQVSTCYFGDGASEEGGFHESLNLAAIYELPIIFVCENNLYSSHLDIQLRQPQDSISRFAKAHCLDYEIVDGNNVIDVNNSSKRLIDLARHGKGPVFLEAVTYRWLGHVGPDENIDVGVRRSKKDLDAWKKRDPIKRLRQALVTNNIKSENELDQIRENVETKIKEAIDFAKNTPYPSTKKLTDYVYKQTNS